MSENKHTTGRGEEVGFNSVKLLSNVPFGTGSYGSVYKAQCDDLVCAAKVLHPTLVAETVYKRSPQKKFTDEIEFLGHLRHPNIVQFLGVTTDTNTKLPILLMELMDESVTQFLERFEHSLPVQTQLHICHSVAMALSYLHANGIVHRDLSSNNVLMLGSRCIKVSDFGMAKFRNQRFSNTVCPGTEVYMPPEAVLDNPTYTEKIDCFSFGVLTIQIITKNFPSPGPRNIRVTVNGRALLEPQSEYNRRLEDILKIPDDHILRGVACNCLQETERDRPSASRLCSITARLKHNFVKQRTPEELAKDLVEKERELLEMREHLQRRFDEIKRLKEQVQSLTQRLGPNVESSQLQLHESIASFQPLDTGTSIKNLSDSLQQTKLKPVLNWKEGPEAPCPMARSCDAVVCGCFMYVIHQETRSHLFVYNNLAESWSQLPDCPASYCSLAVIKDSVVTVGGLQQDDGAKTNKLYTLSTSSGQYFWSLDYPPMPTRRRSVILATSGSCLVVMGGVQSDTFSKKVEVMHTECKTWSVAASLPISLHLGSAVVSGNRIFVVGGWVSHTVQSYAAVSCTLDSLINSSYENGDTIGVRNADMDDNVWNNLSNLPVTQATCISYQSSILAVGGQDKEGKPSSTVLAYNDANNSWITLTDLCLARSECIAAVLPIEIIVLGGYTGKNFTNKTNTVEVMAELSM